MFHAGAGPAWVPLASHSLPSCVTRGRPLGLWVPQSQLCNRGSMGLTSWHMEGPECSELSSLSSIDDQPGCPSRLSPGCPWPLTHLRGNGWHPIQPSPLPPGQLSRELPGGPSAPWLRAMGFTWPFPVPEQWAGLALTASLLPTSVQGLACPIFTTPADGGHLYL